MRFLVDVEIPGLSDKDAEGLMIKAVYEMVDRLYYNVAVDIHSLPNWHVVLRKEDNEMIDEYGSEN